MGFRSGAGAVDERAGTYLGGAAHDPLEKADGGGVAFTRELGIAKSRGREMESLVNALAGD